MKTRLIVLLGLAMLTPAAVRAQFAPSLPMAKSTLMRPYELQISSSKTTHLIFPYEIRYADLGSKEIAGESLEKAGNVFRLKALSSSPFLKTNLTVITADGRVFSFAIGYNENPEVTTYDLSKGLFDGTVSKSAKITAGSQARLADNLNKHGELAMQSRRKIKHIGYKTQGMNLYLKSVLYKDDVMYLVIGLDNSSKLDYRIDYLKTYVLQLKRPGENAATQDVTIEPIKIFDVTDAVVPRHDELTKVIAIERLTLERDRRLVVQAGEAGGARQLTISIGSEELATARPL